MYLKGMKRFFRFFRLFIIIILPCCASAQINAFYSTEKYPLFNPSSDSVASCSNDSLAHNVIISPRLFVISDNNKTEKTLTYLYGFSLHSNFTKKLNFRGAFDVISESHHSLLNEFKDSLTVFPTFGRDNKRLQYNCSYQFNKFITTDFGKGKHFIGNGYRSLLLSAEHSLYPYLKLTTEFGRVRYYNLYTTFLDIQNPLQDRKKHASIHFLNFELTKNINIGVFEGVLWRSKDKSFNRGYDLAYLNPIIFFRPVEYSKHSPDNVLMGANFNANFNATTLYGQVLLDDLNISDVIGDTSNGSSGFLQNKFAVQFGGKTKINGVNLLIEYNQAQPYTYAHKEPMQTYTHLNQALAHPLGANFKEMVSIAEYQYNKWNFRIKYTSAKVGLDSTNTHYGQNIFASDFDAQGDGQEYSYGNFNGQGVLTTINTLQTEIAYPLKWITVFGSIMYKAKKSDLLDQTSVWYSVGVRTFPFSTFTDY
jgi:hypothetical protein